LATIAQERPVHPRVLGTAPPVALTSILEVLRNPPSTMNMLPPDGIPRNGYSVVWFNYVRSLGAGPDQTRYFLIPGVEDVRLPDSCLRSLSPRARREYEAEERAQRAGSVTLEAFNGEEEASAIPYTAEAIEKGNMLLAVTDPSNSTLAIAGVVPDGVASVTITAANSKTVTATVTNNLFLALPPANGLTSLMDRLSRPSRPGVPAAVSLSRRAGRSSSRSPRRLQWRKLGSASSPSSNGAGRSWPSRDAWPATASGSQAIEDRAPRSITSGRCSPGAVSNTR
jgi:hypothetical protein